MEHKCSNCGTEFDGNFCPNCGASPNNTRVCPHCGAEVANSAKFCNNCGRAMEVQQNSAPTAQPRQPKPPKEPREPIVLGENFFKVLSKVCLISPRALIAVFAVLTWSFGALPLYNFFMEDVSVYSSINNDFVPELNAVSIAIVVFAALSTLLAVIGAITWRNFARSKTYTISALAIYCSQIIITSVALSQIKNLGYQKGSAPIVILVFGVVFFAVNVLTIILSRKFAPSQERMHSDFPSKAKAFFVKVGTWFRDHWKAFVSVTVIVAVVATAVGVVVPIVTNNFRANKVQRIDIGDSPDDVRAVLGEPANSDNKDCWEYFGGKYADLQNKIDDLNKKIDDLSNADDLGLSNLDKITALSSQVLDLKQQQTQCEYPYIRINFEKDYEKMRVKSVMLDTHHSATSDFSKKEAKDIRDLEELFSITKKDGVYILEKVEGYWPEFQVFYTDGSYTYSDIYEISGVQRDDVTVNKSTLQLEKGTFDVEFTDDFGKHSWVYSIEKPTTADLLKIGNVLYEHTKTYNRDVLYVKEVDVGTTIFSIPQELNNYKVSFDSNLLKEIEEFSVHSDNQYYATIDGVLYNKYKRELVQFPLGSKKTSFVIPDSVTKIGMGAFVGCNNITSITIPDSVTFIDDGAFADCINLTSIKIPNSVTKIGLGAFDSCSSITSITIPDSITFIDDVVFAYCINLMSITIPNSVTKIGLGAFEECYSLASITFEGTIEQWNSISKGADWHNGVPATQVVCSDGVVEL